MNHEEYLQWERDAEMALSGRYSPDDIRTILEWFRCIKGADERALIGDEAVDAMLVFTGEGERFDLYNSLMARAFVYAPLILAEARQEQARQQP